MTAQGSTPGHTHLIDGRFRLIAVLGVGGFGQVWRAYDETLDVEVAMKQIRIDPFATPHERERALDAARREARNAAKLRDKPNIVAVHEFVADREAAWLVMRLVKGRTLAHVIKDRGRLPPDEARKVALGVLTALADVHEQGLVHRDVKPANIMLADDDTVLLTDFGIAKPHAFVTQATISGTPAYMAPERFAGKDLAAGDMWALGVTLFEMVEGRVPPDRSRTPVTPRAFASLIRALMDEDPAKRPDADRARRLLIGSGQDEIVAGGWPTATAGAYIKDLVLSKIDEKLGLGRNSGRAMKRAKLTRVGPPVKLRSLYIRNGTRLKQPLRVSEYPTKVIVGTVGRGDTAKFELPDAINQIVVETLDGKRKSAPQALAGAIDPSYSHQFVVYAKRAWSDRSYPNLLIVDEGARRPTATKPAWKRPGPIAGAVAVILAVAAGVGIWYTGYRSINHAHAGDCVEHDVTKSSSTWHLVTCAIDIDGKSGDDTYYAYKVILRIDGTTDVSLCASRIPGWNAAIDTGYAAESSAGPAAHVLCLRPK